MKTYLARAKMNDCGQKAIHQIYDYSCTPPEKFSHRLPVPRERYEHKARRNDRQKMGRVLGQSRTMPDRNSWKESLQSSVCFCETLLSSSEDCRGLSAKALRSVIWSHAQVHYIVKVSFFSTHLNQKQKNHSQRYVEVPF